MMYIVTAGAPFLDIDAYGGCVAYAELLEKSGHEARAVSTAPLNESITAEVRSWNAQLFTDYQPNVDDEFVLVDVSDPEVFDSIVDLQRVTTVIDHHSGTKELWQHLGQNATIEFIGAACTLVYEAWQAAGKFEEMSTVSARILATGILDNTLDFKAGVTTDRDRDAYAELMMHAELPVEWSAQYFTDCQRAMEANLPEALRNDSKTMKNTQFLPQVMGQLVVWDAKDIVKTRRDEIAEVFGGKSEDWAVNVVSINEGKSYFLTLNPITQAKFGELMDVDLSSGIAEADRLYLRKEIMKRSQEKAGQN